MNIPDPEFWGAVGTFATACVSFAFYVERKFLPKDEHVRICTERNETTGEKLEAIHKELSEQRKDARNFQNDIRNAVHSMGLTVAVIQTKLRIREEKEDERS